MGKALQRNPEFNAFDWDLRLYGSRANGFAEPSQRKESKNENCDVDCTFLIDPKVMAEHKITLQSIVDAAVEDHVFVCTNIVLTAKVPVACLRVGDNVMDVTINNHDAIRNTSLLREYSQICPKCREFVLAVKSWAKKNNLTNASEGKFSSYSWTIMALVYLQAGSFFGRVFPSLQELAEDSEFLTASGFLSTHRSILELPPVQMLVQDFLYWLAFRLEESHVLSLREGRVVAFANVNHMALRMDVPNIEDPFEKRNLNTVVSYKQAQIFRSTVWRGFRCLAEMFAMPHPCIAVQSECPIVEQVASRKIPTRRESCFWPESEACWMNKTERLETASQGSDLSKPPSGASLRRFIHFALDEQMPESIGEAG